MTQFERRSRAAAAAFLQSVVLVDDQARFVLEAEVPNDEELVDPDDDMPTRRGDSTETEPVGGRPASVLLDAGLVTSRFAENGLVCAVLKPSQAKRLEAQTLSVAERSDIVILDWQMGDDGQLACELMRDIHRTDDSRGDRMRLIVVYTAMSPLRPIAVEITKAVGDLHFEAEHDPVNPNLVSRKGNTKIVLLSKGGAVNEPAETRQVVEVADLPDRVVEEFAKFAGGLLPNATIAAIGELRRNTHRMLSRLDRSLDGAILSHRALLSHSSDAPAYLSRLIHEEMAAQIPLERITEEYAGREAIEEFLGHRTAAGLPPKLLVEIKDDKKTPARQELKNVSTEMALKVIEGEFEAVAAQEANCALEHGVAEFKASKLTKPKAERRHLAVMSLAGENAEQAAKTHLKFSIVSGTNRTFEDDIAEADLPRLQLGTVLKLEDEFLVCITPVCDCVRIGVGQRGDTFSFVRMTLAPEKFALVIPQPGGPIKLELDRKNLHVVSLRFPNKVGTILARRHSNTIVFDTLDEPAEANRQVALQERKAANPDMAIAAEEAPTKMVQWIAELKPMQAQRIVGSVALHLSRIGLDEFEWLRVQAGPWN